MRQPVERSPEKLALAGSLSLVIIIFVSTVVPFPGSLFIMLRIIKCILIFSLLFSGTASAQRSLRFSDLDWSVRSGQGGPGPNTWSDDLKSVWVDTSGCLHLKVRKSGNDWLCAEVYLQQSYGFGEYFIEIESDVEQYDPNLVIGFFTYETDEREIDIEFSRWGDSTFAAGWYTVQPAPYSGANQANFSLGLKGRSSTHFFTWSADSILFRSYCPYMLTLPPNDSLIYRWNYTGSHIPPTGNERLHINFWLFHGNSPQNQQEAELVIKQVRVPDPYGVPDITADRGHFTLFPNPALDRVSIRSTDNEPLRQINLFNASGILLQSISPGAKEIQLDVSVLARGVYALQIFSEKHTGTLRLLLTE